MEKETRMNTLESFVLVVFVFVVVVVVVVVV